MAENDDVRLCPIDDVSLEGLLANCAEFSPFASLESDGDTLSVVLEDVSIMEMMLSSGVVVFFANHGTPRVVGGRLLEGRSLLNKSASRPDDSGRLSMRVLVSLYADQEQDARLSDLMEAIPETMKIPLFFCPECSEWQLFAFEDWNMCDECALDKVFSSDFPPLEFRESGI